jgi:hypothetical protein
MGYHVAIVDNGLDAGKFLAIDDYITSLYGIFLTNVSTAIILNGRK